MDQSIHNGALASDLSIPHWLHTSFGLVAEGRMARTGRPRGFNRNEAVERAMRLFWEHGYEATSLAMLRAAMGGLSAASFYGAFASKEALFREALALYVRTHGRVTAPLLDPDLPPREAVEWALRGSARMQTAPGHPSGCLLCLSALVGSSLSKHVQDLLAAERSRNRDALRAQVERAVTLGELSSSCDVPALAALANGVLVSLSTEARDGVPLERLEGAITQLMALWDAHRDWSGCRTEA